MCALYNTAYLKLKTCVFGKPLFRSVNIKRCINCETTTELNSMAVFILYFHKDCEPCTHVGTNEYNYQIEFVCQFNSIQWKSRNECYRTLYKYYNLLPCSMSPSQFNISYRSFYHTIYLLNLCSIFTLFRLSHQMFHSPSLRASIQWEWLSWLTLRKTPTTPPRNTLQTFTKKDAENPRIGARACNVMLIHSREYFWRFPSCTPAYTRLVQIWLN